MIPARLNRPRGRLTAPSPRASRKRKPRDWDSKPRGAGAPRWRPVRSMSRARPFQGSGLANPRRFRIVYYGPPHGPTRRGGSAWLSAGLIGKPETADTRSWDIRRPGVQIPAPTLTLGIGVPLALLEVDETEPCPHGPGYARGRTTLHIRVTSH